MEYSTLHYPILSSQGLCGISVRIVNFLLWMRKKREPGKVVICPRSHCHSVAGDRTWIQRIHKPILPSFSSLTSEWGWHDRRQSRWTNYLLLCRKIAFPGIAAFSLNQLWAPHPCGSPRAAPKMYPLDVTEQQICVARFHDHWCTGKFCVPLGDSRLSSAGLIQQGGVGWELWLVGVIWFLLIIPKKLLFLRYGLILPTRLTSQRAMSVIVLF